MLTITSTCRILPIALFLLVCPVTLFSQTNKEKALEKGRAAISLMNEGKFAESIKLLEEAQQLEPDDINYPYEIAYAYYAIKDFKNAVKYLEGILKHKDVNDRVYQLLGNTYDNLGKPEKAIETYEAGLKEYPSSGNLYLEMGVMQMGNKDYNKALTYYEKGIEMDPRFPSNYYWASRIYCSSTEEVWGMIYGEIFMNLERNSKRTSEISKLLFDTYKSEIKFTSDTSFTVSFSQNATIDIATLSDTKKMKLPFGIGVYEPTLIFSALTVRSINIHALDTIRSNFVDHFFSNGHDKEYPNILFSYQQQIKKAGHMEAYNYWLLMKGDEERFDQWHAANKDKWDAFVKWFTENKLKVDNNNKFHSRLY